MVKLFADVGMRYLCMGYIHCCGTLHKTKSFKLVPQSGFILCELDYLAKCPVCGHTVVQLTRIDEYDNISTVRKVNKKAREFFSKMKKFILYEKILTKTPLFKGKFYLNYNEYGVLKRCYSNFSTLKIGLYENKFLNNNNIQSF